LAASYRERPLWHDGVVPDGAAVREPEPLPATADVVVIGAGYCGATAAAGLARRGRRVVVLEAGDDGSGASTRNGGMVIPELKHGPDALVRRHGDTGRAMLRETLAAYAFVRDLVADEAIACDWRESGGLLLAHHPHQVPALRQAAGEWADAGQAVRFLGAADLRSEIGSDAFAAGMLMDRTAAVQPAKLHAALVARARAAGPTCGIARGRRASSHAARASSSRPRAAPSPRATCPST
jgi:glycine/D-amino acid oxidase-like deaminating enzyme